MPVPTFTVPEWDGRTSILIDAPPAVGWRIVQELLESSGASAFVRVGPSLGFCLIWETWSQNKTDGLRLDGYPVIRYGP
jgi:hypothetical protein